MFSANQVILEGMVLRRLTMLLLLVAPFGTAQEIKQSVVAQPASDLPTASPESQGYSSARLEVLRAWLHTGPTNSMMVLANGKVIFSYGDVAHISKIASVRKSVLSMLMALAAMCSHGQCTAEPRRDQ